MSITTASTAQDKLGTDIEQLIEAFKVANPEISLETININTWDMSGIKVVSSISIKEDDARITRTTEQQA